MKKGRPVRNLSVRDAAIRRAAYVLVASVLMSGCYSSTAYDKYPNGKFVDEPSLLKLWKSPDGSLTLKSHGAFTAQDLRLQYFECTSAGLASKAGAGDWEFAKGRQASEVLIRFSDGCSATLWAGERSGRIILWSTDTDSDQVFIFEGA